MNLWKIFNILASGSEDLKIALLKQMEQNWAS